MDKCDGDVWLQNGWREFAKYYSLAYGHFLVFRYEENSHFSVVICDRSTSEIEYPYVIAHSEKSSDSGGEFQEPEMDETEDDFSVEILDHIFPCPKRREKSPLPCPRSHKSLRTNSTFKRNIDSRCSTQELGGGEGKSTARRGSQSKILGRMQPLTASEKASAFKSDNPFFMITMQASSYIKSRPSIPTAFARKYLIMKQGYVILYLSDDRTWSVKYLRGASNSNPNAKFSDGWKAFTQDNHLKVGDVGVFELMKGTEISLKVVLFRLVEDANCHLSPADENGANRVEPKKSPVINIKSDCTSDHANCVPTGPSLHLLNSTKNFQVPKSEDIENDISVEILDDFTRCSKAKKKSPLPYLQSHEKRETNPSGNSGRTSKTQTVAPACSPEGIQSKGLKLQKSKRNLNLHNFTRSFGVAHSEREEGCGGRTSPLTPKEKARAIQRACAFKSEYPFFVVAMQPSYIHRGFKLNVPIKVIEKLIKQISEQIVTLKVADSSWSVKLIFYPQYYKAEFSSGPAFDGKIRCL